MPSEGNKSFVQTRLQTPQFYRQILCHQAGDSVPCLYPARQEEYRKRYPGFSIWYGHATRLTGSTAQHTVLAMPQTWLGKTKTIYRLGFTLSSGTTLAILCLIWIAPTVLTRFENVSLDLRFKLRGTRTVGSEVVIVAIDEKSLQELGRWPWSRDKQAELVRTISRDAPKVIGLDILYTEPEVTETYRNLTAVMGEAKAIGSDGAQFERLLLRKLEDADTDGQLAQSLRMSSNTVLALPLIVPKTGVAAQPSEKGPDVPEYLQRVQFMVVRDIRGGRALEPFQAANLNPPLQALAEAALSLGHVYGIPDPDGVTRFEYLALRYGEGQDYYPSLGLEVARAYLGLPRERMDLILGYGVRLGNVDIPADQKARMFLNYAGPERSFPYVSATDVLHGRLGPGTFSDKVVLVGTTALGTYDQKATPFTANFPGVEQIATVVENILHRQFLEKSVWSGPLDVSIILLFGLALGHVLPRVNALSGAGIAGLALLGYAGVVQYLFVAEGIVLDLVAPVLTIGLAFVSITVLRFMTVEKEKDEIRTLFTPYVGPQIVQELIRDPGKARIGLTQRRELTMLFCDVVGFTTFCERHDADQVVSQVNEYLAAMTEVVFRWNGTLVDFMGDEVYAFWGAPLDQPDHAELAVKCALHLRKRLIELQTKWNAEGKVPLENGIGINTGEVLVANMGAEGKRMKYAAVGDHVNLAARISGLTRKFGAPILISEHTAERVKALTEGVEMPDNKGRVGHIALRLLASVKVKGKIQPVGIYELRTLDRSAPSIIEEPAVTETLQMTDK